MCINFIENYFKDRSITVIGELVKAFENNNLKTLKWVEYAIKNFSKTKGMDELLAQLAGIEISGTGSERIFKNLLTEIHAACFLSKTLGEIVLEVDSKSNDVISSYRSSQEQQCDIKSSTAKGDIYYYEVKDASSELESRYQRKGITHFNPMNDEKIEKWMKEKTKEAEKKGADFLICRVPVWLDLGEEDEEWIDRIMGKKFKIQKRVSNQEIIVQPNFSVLSYLKGIYIIKEFRYIKVLFDISSN